MVVNQGDRVRVRMANRMSRKSPHAGALLAGVDKRQSMAKVVNIEAPSRKASDMPTSRLTYGVDIQRMRCRPLIKCPKLRRSCS